LPLVVGLLLSLPLVVGLLVLQPLVVGLLGLLLEVEMQQLPLVVVTLLPSGDAHEFGWRGEGGRL
jgi:hypothetical protein